MDKPSLFRENALKHASGGQSVGDVLRLAPSWTRLAYPVLLAAFLAMLAYLIFGTIHEYAIGPAIIWISGRTHLTAAVSGTVSSIEVLPGQKVEAGQILVRFTSVVESAELEQIERQFELQLAKILRDPSDQTARAALTALGTQRDVAAVRLGQLSIRAPQAGIVGDVRIRPGQLLPVGEIALTLLKDDRRCSLLAMLPAQYRPMLRPGMTLRFAIDGYPYAYQEMTITSVGVQIIGPAEVKRFLGQEMEDTVKVEGPVVLVEATPTSEMFVVDGQSLAFYHGTSGTAEARVREESLLVSLVPGLRVVFAKIHG
jgi:multidrug efflux pump subunit AcrA (membrane-fusion protein)